jgi:hypothetical protein
MGGCHAADPDENRNQTMSDLAWRPMNAEWFVHAQVPATGRGLAAM